MGFEIQQGPPTAGGTKKGAAMKRKKGGKGKGKDWSGTAGEILVMPFLSQFHMPADGSDPRSEDVMKYGLRFCLVYFTQYQLHEVFSSVMIIYLLSSELWHCSRRFY